MPEKYIPNWREAEAQRRRPSYSSRQTLRKAPVVAAAPEKYYIQDIEVDRKTYQRYEKQQYDLGDGCKVSLLGVGVYATSQALAEGFPQEAEAAKRIMAQIRAELTKGEKQMSNPKTANDYLKALKDIYTQSRSSYEAMQKEADAARERMNAAYDMLHDPACKDKQTAKIRHEIAQGEYKLAKETRAKAYQKMQNDHAAKVTELRTQLSAYLDDHYAAAPDKLDMDTMQLLNTGICTASELARLADRHSGNPTMLRIIGSHAEKLYANKDLTQEERQLCTGLKHRAVKARNGSRELEIFDGAVSIAAYGLDKDYNHATQMHGMVPEWLEGYDNQMSALSGTAAEK